MSIDITFTSTDTTSTSNSFSCSICERKFTLRQNMRHHMKKFHPTAISNYVSVTCGVCKASFQNALNLEEHMDCEHNGVNLIVEKQTFSSMEQFEEWKSAIETKSQSCFVKHRGSVPLAGGRTGMYFYCHRSGRYEPRIKRKERKRRVKYIGSNKIGKACPARITAYQKVIDEAIKIEVEYQSTHICSATDKELSRLASMRTVQDAKAQLCSRFQSLMDMCNSLEDMKYAKEKFLSFEAAMAAKVAPTASSKSALRWVLVFLVSFITALSSPWVLLLEYQGLFLMTSYCKL